MTTRSISYGVSTNDRRITWTSELHMYKEKVKQIICKYKLLTYPEH